MATKTYTGIQDRLVNSLNSIQKGEWYDTMQTYNDYPLCRVAMESGKERSGNQLTFRLGVGSDNEDGHHGLYEDFDLDRPDVMTSGTVPWVNHRKGFAIDEREIEPKGDPESVIDDLMTLRNNMFSQIADDMEAGALNVPSASDVLMPRGLPYYIVWDTTAQRFTPDLPAGHTSVAGVDPAVQTDYRNWSDTYATATRDDLGLKVSKAIRNTGWKPPAKVKGLPKVTHAIYMDQTTLEQNEVMAANQNDQNGVDTQPMFNRSMLARVTPTWLPILDTAAASGSNPLYIVNHGTCFPVFRKGWKFREYPARQSAKQPTAVEVSAWAVYNWTCPVRKQQAVIAKSAPFGETS